MIFSSLQTEQKRLSMQAARVKQGCGSIQTPDIEEYGLEALWVEGLLWRLFSG